MPQTLTVLALPQGHFTTLTDYMLQQINKTEVAGGKRPAPVFAVKAMMLLAFAGLAGLQPAAAQQAPADTATFWKKMHEPKAVNLDGKKIEITQTLQLWNVYTLEQLGEQEVEHQNDLYIRRGRLGVKGNLQKNLAFNINFAYDGVGRDKETAGNGSPNPDDNHDFYLWEAFAMWQYKPLLNITAGYFRPQVGREHMTAAVQTSSFEKSLSNFQPRAHAIARSTGRELGLNLGGLYLGQGWSFNYNLGVFDMSGKKLIGEKAASEPMLASRVALTLGDPEMEKYGIGYNYSSYGKRKGITFGLNSTYQGETSIFRSNSFYGGDVMANWGPWDASVEYDWLYRSTFIDVEPNDLIPQIAMSSTDRVSTYRLVYNYVLKNGQVLQAAGMYSAQHAQDAGNLGGFNEYTAATDQKVYDLGINYLINKNKLKLNLHYVWGESADEIPYKYYSYLGTGFQYVF